MPSPLPTESSSKGIGWLDESPGCSDERHHRPVGRAELRVERVKFRERVSAHRARPWRRVVACGNGRVHAHVAVTNACGERLPQRPHDVMSKTRRERRAKVSKVATHPLKLAQGDVAVGLERPLKPVAQRAHR